MKDKIKILFEFRIYFDVSSNPVIYRILLEIFLRIFDDKIKRKSKKDCMYFIFTLDRSYTKLYVEHLSLEIKVRIRKVWSDGKIASKENFGEDGALYHRLQRIPRTLTQLVIVSSHRQYDRKHEISQEIYKRKSTLKRDKKKPSWFYHMLCETTVNKR